MVLRRALSSQNGALAKLGPLDKVNLTNDSLLESPQLPRGEQTYRQNRRLTPAERAQLAKQYELGLSALDLARQYGINRHTVTKHLRKEGVTIRGGQTKLTSNVIAKGTQLYAAGQSLADVGAHLGVDTSTVHKAFKRAGVKLRDTHGREY